MFFAFLFFFSFFPSLSSFFVQASGADLNASRAVAAQLQHHTDEARRAAAAAHADAHAARQAAHEATTHVAALEAQLERERARTREMEALIAATRASGALVCVTPPKGNQRLTGLRMECGSFSRARLDESRPN